MQLSEQGSCYSIMQPVDFVKLALPKKFNEMGLFLCPQEYMDVLLIRMQHFAEIQNTIKTLNMSPD